MSPVPSAASARIVPFWNRLPQILLYPMHMGALSAIVVVALCNLAIFLPLGFIGIILMGVAMYRYAFECLRATANGYLEPPEVGLSVSGIGWKFIGLIMILGFVTAIGVALLGAKLGLILVFLVVLCVPSAIMTLAMEDSVFAALDPGKWISIIFAIGWPYLAVFGLFLAIFSSEGYAQGLVARFMPLGVSWVMLGFIANYALVVTFHLMGYLLYQYHERLGFEPEAPQIMGQMTKTDPDQDVLDQASEKVRDGKPEEAVDILRAHLTRGGGQTTHTQYRKLLRLTDRKTELLEHDRKYISTLMEEEKDKLAVEFLCECQAIDPSFAPETAFQITQLAHIAAKMGQPKAALQLVSVFNERFPKSQYAIDNGLLAASLMHEHLGQDGEALALLQNLKATFPTDPLIPEIDTKIATIERIMTATKKPDRAKF